LAALIQLAPGLPAGPPTAAAAVALLPKGALPETRDAHQVPQSVPYAPADPAPKSQAATYLQGLRTGELTLAEVMRDPSATDLDLVTALRTRYSKAKVRSALATVGVPKKAKIGDLSDRRSRTLLQELARPVEAGLTGKP
ncbi:hypothetical protein, partial [Actinocorallia lasiicapitis]